MSGLCKSGYDNGLNITVCSVRQSLKLGKERELKQSHCLFHNQNYLYAKVTHTFNYRVLPVVRGKANPFLGRFSHNFCL